MVDKLEINAPHAYIRKLAVILIRLMDKKNKIISAGLIAALGIYGVYMVTRIGSSDTSFSDTPGWHMIIFTLPIIFLLRRWAKVNS
jgi:hypothetical protein